MKLGLSALKCKFHDTDIINLRAESEYFFALMGPVRKSRRFIEFI